jgi:hypothetical protein
VGVEVGVGVVGVGVGTPGPMMVIGVVRTDGGTAGSKVTPPRRMMATALPPAVPSRWPSISWPETSSNPEGDVPLIVSWTGLLRENGFLRVRVIVSLAGSSAAELSLITAEFLAVKDPLAFAAVNR